MSDERTAPIVPLERAVTDPRKVAIMTDRIARSELRAKLAFYLDAAESGQVFRVTDRGREVALLGPATVDPGGPGGKRDDNVTAIKAYRQVEDERDGALATVTQLHRVIAKLRAEADEMREELDNAREMAGTAAPRKRGWGRTA